MNIPDRMIVIDEKDLVSLMGMAMGFINTVMIPERDDLPPTVLATAMQIMVKAGRAIEGTENDLGKDLLSIMGAEV